MSRVLITGGAGFIGCRLAAALLNSGHDVAVFDNLHPQVHAGRGIPPELPAGVRFLPGDVTAVGSWDALLSAVEPDTIVHLAAETGTGQSLAEATRHAAVNGVGTAALVEALERRGHSPDQIVLASSRAVYGDGTWLSGSGRSFYPGHRTPEMLERGQWDYLGDDGLRATPLAARADRTEPRPTNVYAATKLAQEHILAAWCGARDVPLSVLRLQNVYGPGQSVTNSYTGVLTFFARAALAGQALDVYEDGEIVRDFVFVDDVVAALAAAVTRPSTRTVDIGSGQRSTILEVARAIAASAGSPAPVVSGRYRPGDVRAAWCEIDLAVNELSYSPTNSLSHGIDQLLEWVAASELQDFPRSPGVSH